MGYILSRRKHARKVLTKAKNRRRTTIISHVNSNESTFLKYVTLIMFKEQQTFVTQP